MCNTINSRKNNVLQDNYIQEINYTEFSSEEILDNYKEKIIKFKEDSIFLIEEIIENKKRILAKKINSTGNVNFDIFLNIPEPYLNSHRDYEFLNYYPENDGGGVRVEFLRIKDTVIWTLSGFNEDLPLEIQGILDIYDKMKIKFISNE